MKKLLIETYGCQMNVADSEVVASVMQMAGYEVCETVEEADAVFLNTCSVRDNAEQKIYHRLDVLAALRKSRQKNSLPSGGTKGGLIIGVLGCMAERVKDDLLENHHCDLVAGPDAYLTLPDLVAQAELGHKAINVELSTTETYRDVIPQRIGLGHKIGGFVSIMRGCNNFCHYCIVPFTRGRERSRDVESILREVRDLRDRGFKEVTLLGQNVNSYGLSLSSNTQTSFAQLLHLVAREVPEMRVRFTTSNPEDMTEDILHAIAEEPNLCRHIHFPAQSGSNRILKLMNRKYTREDYLQKIDAIRRIIPGCGITTDVFVGYHDETEEDFQQTLSLVREVGFDSAFMFKYSERPDSMNSLPCRRRFPPSATRRTKAVSLRCSWKVSASVVVNNFAVVPSRTRWSSSIRLVIISASASWYASPVAPAPPFSAKHFSRKTLGESVLLTIWLS